MLKSDRIIQLGWERFKRFKKAEVHEHICFCLGKKVNSTTIIHSCYIKTAVTYLTSCLLCVRIIVHLIWKERSSVKIKSVYKLRKLKKPLQAPLNMSIWHPVFGNFPQRYFSVFFWLIFMVSCHSNCCNPEKGYQSREKPTDGKLRLNESPCQPLRLSNCW